MSERYLALMANYAARDNTALGLAVLAVGLILPLIIIETSPFISGHRDTWRNAYLAFLVIAYLAGTLYLGTL